MPPPTTTDRSLARSLNPNPFPLLTHVPKKLFKTDQNKRPVNIERSVENVLVLETSALVSNSPNGTYIILVCPKLSLKVEVSVC